MSAQRATHQERTARALHRLHQASGAAERKSTGGWAASGPIARVFVIGVVAFLGYRHWAGISADALPIAVRDEAFWFNIFQALILCYTVLEQIYRSKGQRLLVLLPTEPHAWFRYVIRMVAFAHAPVGIACLAWFAPLAAMDATLFGIAALSVTLAWFIIMSLALAVHLQAGGTLMAGESNTKRALAGGLAPAGAAYLFYAPAVAFGGAMIFVVGIEIAVRLWFEKGDPTVLGALLVAAVVGLAYFLRLARDTFVEFFAAVLPRFWESEVVAPFREVGELRVPRVAAQSRWLPTRELRARVWRDIVQVKRRHRADWLVLAGIGGFTLAMLLRREAPVSFVGFVGLCTALSGGLLNPALRVVGAELESPYALNALPAASGAIVRSKAAATFFLWTPVWVLGAAVYGLVTTDVLLTLGMFAALAVAHVVMAQLSVKWLLWGRTNALFAAPVVLRGAWIGLGLATAAAGG